MDPLPNFEMKTPDGLIAQRREMMRAKEKGEKIKSILEKYNVSKPVFYKICKRYQKYGELGLRNLSKAPHNHGRRTPVEKEEQLRQLYRDYPYFSSYEFHELVDIPPSTIQRIAKGNNLVTVYKPKSENLIIMLRAPLREQISQEDNILFLRYFFFVCFCHSCNRLLYYIQMLSFAKFSR